MVGRVIRLGAPLRPPTDDGDENGTADDANIVRQTTTSSTSMSHHDKHRHGRMTTPVTKLVPNDKGTSMPAPQEYTITTTKQIQRQQREYNNTDNNNNNNETRGKDPDEYEYKYEYESKYTWCATSQGARPHRVVGWG